MDNASILNTTAIAVIGIGCKFPQANGPELFWKNLRDGFESVTEFSEEDLLAAGVDPSILHHPAYISNGIVLDDVDKFDAAFFDISDQEAELMDPQHRIFIECCWEAVEHAGYDPRDYHGNIGLYAGVDLSTYQFMNVYSSREALFTYSKSEVTRFNDKDFFTARVAAKLNLKGPAVTVQTTCSTSLIAIIQACQSLLNYQCDMALAGGSAITLPQKSGYFYQEGGISSPDGHCRAFDASARGTTGGSGAGVVVLKRLEDALEDGDHIEAIIRGFGINNDGADKVGFTAPSIQGQAEAIAMAQAMAEVSADDISYVEAHGTGTVMGDPIEVGALTQVFRKTTDRKGFCGIGSVKTNIGHCNSAAGVAGLIKTVLALKHKMLPPSLHFQRPNPNIDFENSPFYVVDSLRPWNTATGPRLAGVSSFGIGGTNGHVVLQEAPPMESSSPSRSFQLLTLSAKTATALEQACLDLQQHFDSNTNIALPDVAFTLQTGRRRFPFRKIYLLPTSQEEGKPIQLQQALQAEAYTSAGEKKQVVFLFPGQGSQYVNMGKELYEQEPLFRDVTDQCAQLLQPLLGLDIRTLLYSDQQDAQEQLKQTAIAQPAIFVTSYALARLWISWGVSPDTMIGHSIGELAAACIAGVLSVEEALKNIVEDKAPGQNILSVSTLDEFKNNGAIIIELLPDKENQLSSVLFTLGQCWLEGLQINWKNFYSNEKRKRVSLPTYPFERKRFWMDASWKAVKDQVQHEHHVIEDQFYMHEWKLSSQPSESFNDNLIYSELPMLVLCDDQELLDALKSKIHQVGKKIISITSGRHFKKIDDFNFEIRHAVPGDFHSLFEQLDNSGIRFDTIMHLNNFSARKFSFERIEQAGKYFNGNSFEDQDDETFTRSYFSLVNLSKAILKKGTQENVRIKIVASQLHRFYELESPDPRNALITTACGLIQKEMPFIKLQTIDINNDLFHPLGIQHVVDQLLDELNYETYDNEIMLRNQKRFVLNAKQIELSTPKNETVFKPGNVYLVAGTVNEKTIQIIKTLREEYHALIVLLKNINAPKSLLNGLERGTDLLVVEDDPDNLEILHGLNKKIQDQFGRLNGIIFIDDKPTEQLNAPVGQTIITGQVRNVLKLQDNFSNSQIDFFLMCSFNETLSPFYDALARRHNNRFSTKFFSISVKMTLIDDHGNFPTRLLKIFERVLSGFQPQVIVTGSNDHLPVIANSIL